MSIYAGFRAWRKMWGIVGEDAQDAGSTLKWWMVGGCAGASAGAGQRIPHRARLAKLLTPLPGGTASAGAGTAPSAQSEAV